MYTVTKDGKTFDQWQTEINAKTFDSDWKIILLRVYPDNLFLDDSYPGLSGEQLYKRIRPYQLINDSKFFSTKLPWADIEQEVADYKSDLLLTLTNDFDLLQRRKDYGERIDNLPHFRAAADELGMFSDFGNMAILKEKIIVDDLGFELDQIESKHAELVAEYNIQNGVDKMQAAQHVGNRIVATIAQLNTLNNINATQLQTIYGNPNIQAIIMLLQTGALASAKYQIENLDLTGLEPMDESYRTRIIGMIDTALGV